MTSKKKNPFELGVKAFLKRNKVKFKYQGVPLPYVEVRNRTYYPDFTVITRSGNIIYIETKGWLRLEDRHKMIAVKQSHPNLDIRIVFWANNKLHRGGKMRYGDWADKHGFPWALKTIPKEWLDE